MRKATLFSIFIIVVIILGSFTIRDDSTTSLRRMYSRPAAEWPKPFVDEGVKWRELGKLPGTPLAGKMDSLHHLVNLGKVLFFEPRLSGSGKISCVTCHNPELSWTDHKERSIGHADAINKRNSPTILNSWFYERLFWDGRSTSLEDQAFGPINSESEMNGDMPGLPRKLRQIKAYAALFDSAFGDASINPNRITEALAVFQRTIVSRESRFDEFLEGNSGALTNSELRGLHLFRTKARCINCHNGPLLADNLFHQNGFGGEDKGFFFVTHLDTDLGKFKTPSLRDVNFTGPWMHSGQEKKLEGIIEKYNKAEFPEKPAVDKLIRPLGLTKSEKKDLLAFLKAISAPPPVFEKPVLPD